MIKLRFYIFLIIVITIVTSCEQENLNIQDQVLSLDINKKFTFEEYPIICESPLGVIELINKSGFEIGGSNYPMFDVQKYLDGGEWSTENLFLTIGEYHLNPAKVNAQILTMYDNGQRKIALPLWYSRFPVGNNQEIVKHLVRSNEGHLIRQHEENLINVLTSIKNTGYNEISFRFIQQWLSDPSEWMTGWNEDEYQMNWHFMVNVINVINSTLVGSGIRVYYDLGGELAGIDRGQATNYVKRLWQDYYNIYGNINTVGFSMAYTKYRFEKYINDLKSTHTVLPNEYAIDIYSNDISSDLRDIKDVLIAHGEENKNIVMQEVYYNNTINFENIIGESIKNNLRLRTIYQWPLKEGSATNHFSINFSEEYKIPPYISNAGAGCDDYRCIWIKGQFYETHTNRIELRKASGMREIIGTYYPGEFNMYDNETLITLRLKTDNEVNLLHSEGIRVFAINGTYSTWSTYGNYNITRKIVGQIR